MRKAEHLATDEACRAPFWPTPGLKNRNVYMDSDKRGSHFLRPLYPAPDPVFKYTQKGLLFVRCVSYTEWSCYHKFPLYNYLFHLFLLDILYAGTPNTHFYFYFFGAVRDWTYSFLAPMNTFMTVEWVSWSHIYVYSIMWTTKAQKLSAHRPFLLFSRSGAYTYTHNKNCDARAFSTLQSLR